MPQATLSVKKRLISGSANARRDRAQGVVPGVIFGEAKPSVLVLFESKALEQARKQGRLLGHLIEVNQTGTKETVLVKKLQLDPILRTIIHIDCQRIHKRHKLTTTLQLFFTGEEKSPAFKQKGQVIHHLTDIEVTCLPADLPDHIDVDMSTLEMDQVLHVSDLVLPKGVALSTPVDHDHDLPVVSYHLPKTQEIEAEVEKTPVDPEITPSDMDES